MAANPNAKIIAQLKALETVPWVAPVAAAETIAEYARKLAPVRTGLLKSKIRARHYSSTSNVEAAAKYSGFVEFGTRKMGAQPFLRPAVVQYEKQILEAVAEALIGEIHFVLGKGSRRWKKPPATSVSFPGISVG